MVSRDNLDWKLIINRSEINLSSNKLLDLGWRFTSETLIVQVFAANQLDTWQVAGKLWATSRIRSDHTIFFEKNLDLFAQELIKIPKIFPGKYSLHYRAPRHFTNVRIKIWEYVGESTKESDLLSEQINSLVLQNLRLEELVKKLINKIDSPTNSKLPTEQQKQLIPFF